MIFKRHEAKYRLTLEQLALIKQEFNTHMIADEHGESTICSLYYDTPDFRLIRRSIEKPVYKEKLRIRSYGIPDETSKVFVELKKKYKKVVYKRRVCLTEDEAMHYLATGDIAEHSQITNEIDYFKKYYTSLAPSMVLSYKREAYYAKNDHDFRVTFDREILWRDYDLQLSKGVYGRPLLDSNTVLMEVKTAEAIPLWFVKLLSENQIYKTSFSKYGTAYHTLLEEKQKSEEIIELFHQQDIEKKGYLNYA